MKDFSPLSIISIVSAIAFAIGIFLSTKAERTSDVSLCEPAKWCVIVGYCLLAIAFVIALAELCKMV